MKCSHISVVNTKLLSQYWSISRNSFFAMSLKLVLNETCLQPNVRTFCYESQCNLRPSLLTQQYLGFWSFCSGLAFQRSECTQVKPRLHDHAFVHEHSHTNVWTLVGKMKHTAKNLNTFIHVWHCSNLSGKQSTWSDVCLLASSYMYVMVFLTKCVIL